jgi:hypothetical protein
MGEPLKSALEMANESEIVGGSRQKENT